MSLTALTSAEISLPAEAELVIRDPSGKTIYTEPMSSRAREQRETCEGEAEGPA